MAEQYVVYVAAPSEEPTAGTRQRLADLLGLDPHKLDSLLRRLPAEVTKPIPEATAVTVARRFREAGLQASIRMPGALGATAAPPPPAGTPLAHHDTIAGPAQPGVRSDHADHGATGGGRDASTGGRDPNIWKTQFGGRKPVETEEVENDEDDELFPRSSFAPPNGPKAPSRGLMVALLLVVAVLAALYYLL